MQILTLFKKGFEALSHAYLMVKVNHRDIKPDNILIKQKNKIDTIVIADWGGGEIKERSFGQIQTYTKEQGIMGTLLYMSPDLYKNYIV